MKKIRTSGIYVIRHVATGNCYVGSSKQIEVRFAQHRRKLRAGTHHSSYLQRSWTKYGESAFVFEVIEVLDEPTTENLWEREQYYFGVWKPVFNASPIAKAPAARPDLTKCKKLLHAWIEGSETCLACHNEKRAKWAADHPDEHRRHRRESAQRKLDAEKPERVRKSPAGTRKPYESRATGLCRNGLHPKDPAGCRPCRLETQRKWNAKRPTKTARRRGVRTYRAASPV